MDRTLNIRTWPADLDLLISPIVVLELGQAKYETPACNSN